MADSFNLIAGVASVLSFFLGVAATQWGRRAFGDLGHGLTVPLLGIRLVRIGVYDFFDSRTQLSGRRKASKISDYLATADKELAIIALSLNFSVMHQNLQDELRKLLKTKTSLQIFVFLLDPASPVVDSVATATARGPEELRQYIVQSWSRLSKMADTLDASERQRLHLHLYNTYVANSIVILDPYEKDGRILVENYLYKVPIEGRYSFECRRPGSVMFEKVRISYEQFKEDFARHAD